MVILPTEKRFDWQHAPIVLFIIIILNILIFFGYQFGDDQKAFRAVLEYKQQNFLEKEWPVYQEYLKSNEQQERLNKEQQYYDNLEDPSNEFMLLYSIVSDNEFYQYLDKNAFSLFYLSYVETWALPRQNIHDEMRSVSTYAYGLIPNKISPVTLISYQFLHGGIMHLLGNMIFLIICGFAVEAAIGHLKFLAFYLISGISAGLLFSFMDLSSTTPLVGASGSISGVMAMYLGVFRLRKIEFFYWFFIFVGYFRAPALLLLPVYISKELYYFFTNDGSNVAFMAHAGGFIAGGLLMIVAYLINPKMMNKEYIEEDQNIPKIQIDLNIIYTYISEYKFNSALKSLDKFMKINGAKFEWIKLRYQLLKMQKNKDYRLEMSRLLSMQRLNKNQIKQVHDIWMNNPNDQDGLDNNELYTFAWTMANNHHYKTAEVLFEKLYQSEQKHESLGNLARKLSIIFDKRKDNQNKDKYSLIAQELS
ncbi:MAG: rhomboid family intramembrane serine protease [Marinicellaceae bacterium]